MTQVNNADFLALRKRVGTITAYTDENAQDAVGAILTDTSTIDFTYNDGTPSITADVKSASVTEAMQVLADNTTNDVSTTKHGYAPKAPNDATKYLDGTGAYSVPSGGSGSGALVLLEQHTASSSASLDFTSWYSSTYDDYLIELVNLIPATNGVGLTMQVSTDGGSTWDSSAVYANAFTYGATNGASGGGGGTGATSFHIGADTQQPNATTGGLVGSLRLMSPGSTALYKQFIGHVTLPRTDVDWISVHYSFIWKATSAVNAFQLKFSSGNIASGDCRVYGIAKS